MSTYTDLNNRIKENITVGYPQDDRITTQKVRLFNEENEYWGTFKGHVTAEDISIKGGQINGAILSDVALCGNIVLSGVDLPKIGSNISQLCTEIQGVQSNLDGEIRDRTAADGEIKLMIQSSDTKISQLCDEVFDMMSAEIDRAVSVENEISIKLSSYALSADVTAINSRLTAADAYLSGEIDDLHTAIDAETQNRVQKDAELCAYAGDVNVSSENRYLSAIQALAAHNTENVQQFAALENRLSNKIEHDRHYDIWGQNEEILKSYPYKLRDYAVNIIKTSLKDGIAKDNEFGGASVAWISANAENQAIVQFYDLQQDQRLIEAVQPNQAFSFDGVETKPTYKNNYNITYYPGDRIILATDQSQYYEVRANKSGDVIGKVKNFLTASDGTFISGRITIDTEDTQLTTFNAFSDREFSTDSRVLSNETEQIVFNSDNKTFNLRKGVTDVYYCPINTETGTVAQILEGNVKYSGTMLTEIDVTFGENLVALTQPSFQTDFGSQTMCCDTVGQTFSLFDRHAYYKYGYYLSTDTEFSGVCYGYVIPALENAYIASDDYTQVSVVIQGQRSTAVNGTYLLDIDQSFAVKTWKTVADLGGGNVLTVRFDGNYVMVDGTIDGTPFGPGKYIVNKQSPTIYNPTTAFDQKWKSTYTDWTQFSEHTTKEAAVFGTTTNGPVSTALKQYKLDITTDGTDQVTVQVPAKAFFENSREFMLVEKFTSGTDRKVRLNIVKEDGVTPVDFFSERQQDLSVWTNRWTTFQFNEIASEKFFVSDLDQNSQEAQIKDLYDKLSAESYARNADDQYISASVDENALSVEDIYERIKGGINYRGQVCVTDVPLSVLDNTYQFCPTYIKDLFALDVGDDVYAALKEKGWERPDPTYTLDTELRNGYMYNVKALNNTSTVRFHLSGNDGATIEVASKDYIIIKTPGSDNGTVKIRDLSSVNVNVIDSEDGDIVHTPLLSAVSADLALSTWALDLRVADLQTSVDTVSSDLIAESKRVDDNFVKLSADQTLSAETVFLGKSDFRGDLVAKNIHADGIVLDTVSADAVSVSNLTVINNIVAEGAGSTVYANELSSRKLSADYAWTPKAVIDNVSSLIGVINKLSVDSLSDVKAGVSSVQDILDLSVGNVEEEILLSARTLSSRIDYVSSVCSSHVPYCMEYFGDVSSDPAVSKYDSLSAWMKDHAQVRADHEIKLGTVYRVSAPVAFESGTAYAVNDYLIVNKNTTLETISFSDVQSVNDYDGKVTYLSGELDSANERITGLQTDVNTLSGNYSSTFISKDRGKNNHVSSDNLIITDPSAHAGSAEKHDMYYVTFDYESLVLKKIEE